MNLAEFIEGRRDQHLAELCEFLRIPSVSAKSEHKPDIERGARWVADNMRSRWKPRESRQSFFTVIMTFSPRSPSISGPLQPSILPFETAIFLDVAQPTTKARYTFT